MMTWIRRLRGTSAQVRRCRECGTVVPAGAGLCPHCHSMDIEDRSPTKGQQKIAAIRAQG